LALAYFVGGSIYKWIFIPLSDHGLWNTVGEDVSFVPYFRGLLFRFHKYIRGFFGQALWHACALNASRSVD
jgi:hypothetical protein